MDRDLFLKDVSRKPSVLEQLQGYDFGWPELKGKRIFFVGMGSSHFAAKTIAHRLQVRGINAYAMLASAEFLPVINKNDVVIAITASGNSIETNEFISRTKSPVLLLTNNENLKVENCSTIYMNASREEGGVSSLSYMATLIALLQLEERLAGKSVLDDSISKAITASKHILDSEELWKPLLSDFVQGPDGVQFAAPLERLASAEQSALMIRECARRKSDASEVGDWSHIDVYLTKSTDYRLIAFTGSRWTDQMLDWTTKRDSKVLLIGDKSPNAELDYPYSDEELVQLLVEVIFAEIIGAYFWYKDI
jgi:glutamine---fructose-6-phosphate transaminase (isomerizing)